MRYDLSASNALTTNDEESPRFIRPHRIHVIANPVGTAVRKIPLLSMLNDVFAAHNVDYEVLVMKSAGDARRLARAAAEDGAELVVACGGDGTVMEVAEGLIGTGVPMAILPGGTANVMALTLGIPIDMLQALELLTAGENTLLPVDMGTVNQRYFLLRTAIGAEAQMTLQTERDFKARWGNLAYVLNGLVSFINPVPAAFSLVLDGMHVEVDGISAMVANSGNVGISGVNIATGIDVSDGLLDVIVIRSGDLPSLAAVAAAVVSGAVESPEPLLHWQAREIEIVTNPPLALVSDGEDAGETPVKITTVPHAVQIVYPVIR